MPVVVEEGNSLIEPGCELVGSLAVGLAFSGSLRKLAAKRRFIVEIVPALVIALESRTVILGALAYHFHSLGENSAVVGVRPFFTD